MIIANSDATEITAHRLTPRIIGFTPVVFSAATEIADPIRKSVTTSMLLERR